jgi:uncharacterized paraquat-inducible protein A
MPRRTLDDDWDDDFLPEDDDEYDPSRDDEDEPTVQCKYCRAEIHEDSVQCPRCGNYQSAEDAPPSAKPWWIIVGTIACLFVAYRWIVGW